MNIPIFYLKVTDEEDRINSIALVESPAIMKEWIALNEVKNKIEIKLEVLDDEQQIVTGPVLIPDLPIYREIKKMPCYVVATAEEIKKLAYKFMKEQRTINLKVGHESEEETTKGVFIYQIFLQDSKAGLKPTGFDLPDGTLFISCKIENPEVWQKIKNKEINGFSIEGYTGIDMTPAMVDDTQVEAIINAILN